MSELPSICPIKDSCLVMNPSSLMQLSAEDFEELTSDVVFALQTKGNVIMKCGDVNGDICQMQRDYHENFVIKELIRRDI